MAMIAMDKQPCDRPRSRVNVFVITPYCEVDIPSVELDRNISYCMRKVPADENVMEVCMGGYMFDVKILPSIILNSRK